MALKGNQYYLLRTTNGREKKYTPSRLLKKANEYFQWVLDNPLMQAEIVKSAWTETIMTKDEDGKDVIKKVTHAFQMAEVPKMRPFTLEGFCNYADIVINTFKNYEKLLEEKENSYKENKEVRDFLIVTSRIRQIIDNHQFEGAAAGFLNPNIIASKLGLINKQEISGNPDRPLEMAKVTMVIKERKLEE